MLANIVLPPGAPTGVKVVEQRHQPVQRSRETRLRAFTIFELAIFVVLAPVRIVSIVFGHGLLYLLKIPLRLLGVLMRVFGYLLIIGLLVGLAAVLFAAVLG